MDGEARTTPTLASLDVEQVVRAATLAPSILNVQPWRFVARADTIELHRDDSRVLPIIDPRHRALTVSCGAALLNLRLAIAALGRRPDVQVLPDAASPTLLAAIRLGQREPPSRSELRLCDAIPRRRTSRVPFMDQPIPPETVVALEDTAATEGASLHVLVAAEAAEMMRWVDQANAMQRTNRDVQREVARWTGRPYESVDGLRDDALGSSPRVPSGVVRDFGVGRQIARRPQADYESTPTLAVLLTHDDDPAAWMRAGQALERVWLEATAAGLGVSLLTQPLELSNLRWRVRPLGSGLRSARPGPTANDRGGWPQVVMRLGVATGATPFTPRRCVADVLTVLDHQH